LITRRDLTPGFQACQAAHAALAFSVKHPEITKVWHTESNFLVILTVEDEDALSDLRDTARQRGITHIAFTEPDLDDEFTALALEPSLDAEKLVANLPLALREEALV
jgi:peptidyl-tRNA hydrolase